MKRKLYSIMINLFKRKLDSINLFSVLDIDMRMIFQFCVSFHDGSQLDWDYREGNHFFACLTQVSKKMKRLAETRLLPCIQRFSLQGAAHHVKLSEYPKIAIDNTHLRSLNLLDAKVIRNIETCQLPNLLNLSIRNVAPALLQKLFPRLVVLNYNMNEYEQKTTTGDVLELVSAGLCFSDFGQLKELRVTFGANCFEVHYLTFKNLPQLSKLFCCSEKPGVYLPIRQILFDQLQSLQEILCEHTFAFNWTFSSPMSSLTTICLGDEPNVFDPLENVPYQQLKSVICCSTVQKNGFQSCAKMLQNLQKIENLAFSFLNCEQINWKCCSHLKRLMLPFPDSVSQVETALLSLPKLKRFILMFTDGTFDAIHLLHCKRLKTIIIHAGAGASVKNHDLLFNQLPLLESFTLNTTTKTRENWYVDPIVF